jgi:hypothetical protein
VILNLTPSNPKCTHCPIHQQRQETSPDQKLRPQRKFTIHNELDIICQYECDKLSTLQLGKQYNCPPDTIQNILRQYGKTPRSLRDAQLLRRGSEDLNFPLSREVPEILKNPTAKSFLPHLIAILLLTDGGAGRRKGRGHYITFTNKAKSLHAIFADLIYYHYNQPPSAYFREYWSKAGKQGHKAYYTTYNRKDDTKLMLNDLHGLSPTYRTRPKRGQTWEDYLTEIPKPTIQFLYEQSIPKEVHTFGIRLAMSAEGTISPMFVSDSRFPYAHLTFACKHPDLKTEWQTYFDLQGLSFGKTNEMIEATQLNKAQKFLNIGGFIKGVKVKINSYYRGLDKQSVLKAILVNRKIHPIEPKLPKPEKHKVLRQRAMQFEEA